MDFAVASLATLKRLIITLVILIAFVTGAFAQDSSNKSSVIEDVLTNFDVCGSLGITVNTDHEEKIKILETQAQYLNSLLDSTRNVADERKRNLAKCETEKRNIQTGWINETAKNEKKVQDYLKMTNELRAEIRELKTEIRALKSADQTSTQLNYAKVISDYKKQVQSLLNAKDCSAGKVDGIIGMQTKDAAGWFARVVKYYSFSGDIFDEQFFNELISNPAKCRVTAKNTKRSLTQSDRTALNGRWKLTATCDNGRVITASGVMKYARNDATTVRYELIDYKNNLGNTAIGTVAHSNIGTSAENITATLWFTGGGTATARMNRTSRNMLTGEDSEGCSLVVQR